MNQLDLFSSSPAEPTVAQAAAERQSWEAKQKPVVVGTNADREKRTRPHAEQILEMLQAGNVTNGEMAAITPRYGGRLYDLRKDGHVIDIVFEDKKSGLTVYQWKGKR